METSFSLSDKCKYLSLNRTMQYGNCSNTCLNNCELSEFKSYYVVWKPATAKHIFARQIRFKSYYVVWKHFHKNTVDEKEIMFKSYYVVWKLGVGYLPKKTISRLNRTMQYGN